MADVVGTMIFCPTCGQQMASTAAACPKCGAPNVVRGGAASDKTFVTALLLCLFFGVFGFHRFYVGRPLSGIFMILTLGGFGFWSLFDLIIIIIGKFRDSEGRLVTR